MVKTNELCRIGASDNERIHDVVVWTDGIFGRHLCITYSVATIRFY